MFRDEERLVVGFAVLEAREAEDRRARDRLRWSMLGAIAVHALLFVVHWPAVGAEPLPQVRREPVVARVEHYVFTRPERRAPPRAGDRFIGCWTPTITGATPTPRSHQPPESRRYRVGVEVVEPTRTFAPSPVYPEAALAARLHGVVALESTIDREGRVSDVSVLRPAPLGMTEAAVEAVRQWRFEPSYLDGRPVEVVYVLTVRFIMPRS